LVEGLSLSKRVPSFEKEARNARVEDWIFFSNRFVRLLAEFDPVPRNLSALPVPDHGFQSMRSFVVHTIILIGALWAVDMAMLDGHNTRAIWQQFNDQGQNFSYGVQRRLNGVLSGH
jgi:hypothetical protein